MYRISNLKRYLDYGLAKHRWSTLGKDALAIAVAGAAAVVTIVILEKTE